MDRAELIRKIRQDDDLDAFLRQVAPVLQDDPGHDLAHCLRVALWTLKLADASVSFRTAVAAALFHDVVNVPKNSPDRHRASEMSAEKARTWLTERGWSEKEIYEVCDAILNHSFSRGQKPATELGRALQDADRLEALGSIGIFRVASTGALMKGKYFHSDDPWAKNRELDDRAYSVDHFFTKLLKLPETMNTEAGKKEAHSRARSLERFLHDLGEEIGEPIPDTSAFTRVR